MRPKIEVALEAADTTLANRRIARAYDRIVDRFWRELRQSGGYEAALARALAGEPREQVRAYLRGYLAAYLRRPGERVLMTRDAFADAFTAGYEQGASDQLWAWGERGDRFSLREPGILTSIAGITGVMAGIATETLDETLLDQAARSAVAGDKRPDFTTKTLVAASAFILPNRGYNRGRAETATRSVRGEVMKRWAVLGAALEPRPHHQAMEGTTIAYTELFPIASGVMWPHDWDRAGPEEWMFCRHFAEYLPAEGAEIEPWWGEGIDSPI